MKTFMLVGDVSDNAGPSNVHRELIAHWPAEEGLLVPRWSNAVSKLMSVVAASMRCDVLLTTGAGRLGAIAWAIARKRNVPVIVLVHGYLPYENEVNNLGLSDEIVREWRLMLHTADVVVTNSEFHVDCLRAAEPDIAEKVRWFNLGIEPFVPRDHVSQGDVIRVAVSGGTRPIKGNEVVARAVSVLQQQGHRLLPPALDHARLDRCKSCRSFAWTSGERPQARSQGAFSCARTSQLSFFRRASPEPL